MKTSLLKSVPKFSASQQLFPVVTVDGKSSLVALLEITESEDPELFCLLKLCELSLDEELCLG